MKPIFTSLAPNTEYDDAWLALKLLFQPWQWKRGVAMEQLEQTFQQYLSVKYARAFISGRTALYSILQALDLKAGDEVLLQAYTCVAVPDPIIWVGAKPIYVDCDADTFNMSAVDLKRKISPQSRVLIIQHTFGLPAGIEKLMVVARQHNLLVIEDCAHALGSEINGRKIGTFGDAAFFSFGRDKIISSVFGGMVVTNREDIDGKLKAIAQEYAYPPRLWILQQLNHPIITTKAKLFYNIGLGKFILALAKILRLTSKAVYSVEKHGQMPDFLKQRMPNVLALLALRQFKKLERFNAHRRSIAALYTEKLSQTPLRHMLPNFSDNHIYLRYTILTPRAASVLTAAKKQHIFLGDWYANAIAPDGVDYSAIAYNPSLCPISEKLASESLNLPTDIHIQNKDAERVVKFLKTQL